MNEYIGLDSVSDRARDCDRENRDSWWCQIIPS